MDYISDIDRDTFVLTIAFFLLTSLVYDLISHCMQKRSLQNSQHQQMLLVFPVGKFVVVEVNDSDNDDEEVENNNNDEEEENNNEEEDSEEEGNNDDEEGYDNNDYVDQDYYDDEEEYEENNNDTTNNDDDIDDIVVDIKPENNEAQNSEVDSTSLARYLARVKSYRGGKLE